MEWMVTPLPRSVLPGLEPPSESNQKKEVELFAGLNKLNSEAPPAPGSDRYSVGDGGASWRR